jgi:tetratricopeptide (TPR) repeat protein
MSAARKTEPKAAAQPNDGGKTVSPALARAVSLHLEGKHKEALKELNTALENGEESAEIYAAKGHLQYELEQYEDAIKSYEKLLTLAPRHTTANFNLGICYEKLGRWNEATEAFQKTLEADPNRNEAQLGLGICLLHQEKPEPAIVCFDRSNCCGSSMKPPRSICNCWGRTRSLRNAW